MGLISRVSSRTYRFRTKKTNMGRYMTEASNPAKSCKSRSKYVRVHFKNTRETAKMLKGMNLRKAQKYLPVRVDGQRSPANIFWNFSETPNPTPSLNLSMLILCLLNTSASTKPQRTDDELTELTVESIHS